MQPQSMMVLSLHVELVLQIFASRLLQILNESSPKTDYAKHLWLEGIMFELVSSYLME